MGRRLGLVIGVNQYQDAAFRPLQYAETDARALAQWLVNDRGGKWQPADVQMALGAHATRELIESLTKQICLNIAGPSDLVLIYFAGHAFLDERTGEGYLALANTAYQQASTGLHLPSLARMAMGQSRAANILFMLDCFQTGQIWNLRRQSPYDARPLLGLTLLNTLQQSSGRLFLCSCRGNDLVPEAGEKNLGMLTYRTIVGLCGPASDPDTGQFTLQALNAFLFKTLGEQQRPQVFGQEQGHIVLIGQTSSLPPLNASAPTPGFRQPEPPPVPGFAAGAVQTAPAPLRTPTTTGSLMAQRQPFPDTASLAQQLSSVATATSPAGMQRQEQSAALLQQARSMIQVQNAAGALQLIDQALQITPDDANVFILKGQLLGTVGRFQEALLVVEQAMRLDGHNALLWSMYAALLTNVGRYEDALSAVEHSLEIDPTNPETYAIKTSIMGHVAAQNVNGNQKQGDRPRRDPAVSFFIALGISFFGLLIGIAGAAIPIMQPNLPIALGIALESIGLALLCINAARGSYLYGFGRVVLTLFFSIFPLGILAALYLVKSIYGRIIGAIQNHPPLLVPFLFLAAWLLVAAAVPLLLSIMSFIAGLIRGVRRKK